MIYNSDLLFLNASSAIRRTLVKSTDIYSFENYCKELELDQITESVDQANIFVINIMNFVTFAEVFDAENILKGKILDKIISGSAKLVINYSHESNHLYSYYADSWSILFQKINSLGIDNSNIIFISGDTNIEKTFSKNKNNLTVIGIDSFSFIFYFWAGKTKSSLKKHDIIFNLDKQHDSLFLNSVPRAHRCILKYEMMVNGLLDKSIWSWVLGDKSPDLGDIKYFVEKNKLDFNPDEVYNFSLNEKILDSSRSNLMVKGLQNTIPTEWIENTIFSLVTETKFDSTAMFVTEKTYKPILFGHPFMLYARPNTLDYLKSNGYQTFPELFDESYDFKFGKDKLQCITENMTSYRDRAKGSEKIIIEKLQHNQNIFLNQSFRKRMTEQLSRVFNG